MNDAARFLGPREAGGFGLDGQWNDDFHHAAHVVLTGETAGYYADFADGPKALAKAFANVFVNDGEACYSRVPRSTLPRRLRRGVLGERPVPRSSRRIMTRSGNRLKSDRYSTIGNPAAARLAVGLLLLAPRIPMLFMGQEYGETNPFPFFHATSRDEELKRAVREGRKSSSPCFGWEEEPADPLDSATRDSAVLSWDWTEPERSRMRGLCAELIALRTTIPALMDFEHVRADLLDGGSVLEVIRDGGDPSAVILYNLTDEAAIHAEAPRGDRADHLFRSEAAPGEPSRSPREFVVIA